VDLPVSDDDDWEDGEEADEEEEDVKGSSKKKAKQHVDQLKRLQEKVRLLSITIFCFLGRPSVEESDSAIHH
jgi:ribosomal 50S subunit-associated protein YjgA (DUF615 family)